MSAQAKAVCVVELNEFNLELLTSAVKQYSLPALQKALHFKLSHYKTNDRYNSGYLEPWVQWVSVHAGIPASLHQIKHLGDVPDLHFPQCWETLSQHQISSGIWGVMNGARAKSKHNLFFLPDPWTFSEQAYPQSLNDLLALPRYASKHYQNLSPTHLIPHAIKLAKFTLKSKVKWNILGATLKLLLALVKHPKKHFVYISYFDYISTLFFAEYKKKYRPQCTILFLNSLAHIQHHHWRQGTKGITKEILFGLQYIDKILAYLFKTFPEDAFVIHNGLSQMNTNHEKPWVLYRQKDPRKFLKALNIPAIKIEQHMTHDGHVFFKDSTTCQQAFDALSSARIINQPLFHVEKNRHDATKLFYMLRFTDANLPLNTQFILNGKKYSFFKYFDKIVTRTGRHTPVGNILSNAIDFPDQIFNHDFNRYLFHYLAPSVFPLRDIEQEIFNDLDLELEEELA